MTGQKVLGKGFKRGMSIVEITRMFLDDETAER